MAVGYSMLCSQHIPSTHYQFGNRVYVSITLNGVQYFFCIKMMDLKLCANCNELKSLDEYHKHIRRPLGLTLNVLNVGGIKNRNIIKNNKDG